MKKKILLSGGTGYIGSHIYNQLSQKYNIYAPTHAQLDLLDYKKVERYIRKHSIDTVIHTAVAGGSQEGEGVANSLEINLSMLTNITRCSKYYRKLIHFGSGAEYDKARPLTRVKEGEFGLRIPKDVYGFYKYLASKYIVCDAKSVTLRLFGIFGSGEDYRFRFISNAICRSIFTLPIIIRQNVRFDYLYIHDLIRIVEYFMEHHTKHQCYNVGTGQVIDLLTLAHKINSIGNLQSEIIVQKKGLNHEYTCDVSRLVSEVGQLDLTPIDTSLRELYMWYQSHKKVINPSLL